MPWRVVRRCAYSVNISGDRKMPPPVTDNTRRWRNNSSAPRLERIAERKRRAAEKQRRREEHERNRQRGIERRAAEARAQEARAAARRGEKPPLPTVIHKKRRRVEPQEPDPKTRK